MSRERAARSWAPVGPLTQARELEAVWMFVKRDLLLQTYFKFSYLTSLLGNVSTLIIYGMIASLGRSDPQLQVLAGGYVNFVISGLIVNTLLATALSGPYDGLIDSFWNNRLEVIMASPLRLPLFVTGLSIGRYADSFIRIALYLIGGALFLGFTWPAAPRVLALLAVLLPALVACTGLGLIAASTVYTLDARGGQDPVRFVVETVAGPVAGVYFPLQMLPAWVQWLGHLIPHTYAIDGIRRALFGATSVPLLPIHAYLPLPPLLADCLILWVYALIVLPAGWRLFRYGIHLARCDGRLSRWL